MTTVDVAVLGAGPYGLATTAHLRRAGAEVRIVGEPMFFWRTMPTGMVLRSNWTATCIAEYEGPLSLDSYCAASGARFTTPVPLERFLDYGAWVQQQVAPDVDSRAVERVEPDGNGFLLGFADGERLRARRVVVAAGIASFVHRPSVAARLPRELASHTADHRDLSRFSGRRVLVVGGGQSALESAALLHEAGADAEVAVRSDRLNWLHGGKYHRMLGRWAPLVYAPTDVGPMGLSRLVAVPDLFRRLPRPVQGPVAHRSIRPAGAAWLRSRLEDVPIRLGTAVQELTPVGDRVRARLSTGYTLTVDHVLFGTGYRVDITRYPFLAPSLLSRVERVGGYPLLRRGMESSVPGLHIVGAPAAWSFGPIMRFVAGGWYAGRAVAGCIAEVDRRRGRAVLGAPVGRRVA
jgi:NADPH-dependent 2,4-dienoyl-CoA reductase/sulfur reductase-like enzyme